MIKILLIEDHPVILRVMQMMLTMNSCMVDQATSGVEALELFKKNEYDLILLDIGLPDTNGLSIIEVMRQDKNLKKAKTPVIITSAHSDEEYRNQAAALGVDDFLIKPLTLESCEAFVKKYSR